MGTVGTVVAMVALAIVWRLWSSSRSKVIARTQLQFTHMVDALEEGDIERAAICERLFNKLSDDALHRFSLEQLVKRRYVNEQDAVRIHALHEFQVDNI